MRAIIAGLLVAAVLVSRAQAFDSAEHCSLSNFSAQVAFDFVATQLEQRVAPFDNPRPGFVQELQRARQELLHFSLEADSTPEQQKQKFCPRSWQRHVKSIPLSYGKIAALADFALTPQDLFQATGSLSRVPASHNELNPAYFDSGSSFELMLRYWSASHNNLRHFQAPALESFYQLHAEALGEARYDVTNQRRSLFRPLAYSAVANHFLEDVFAPGHLVTPRDGMYDAAALSWHDAFNDRGRMLAVRHWKDLHDLAAFLRDRGEPDGSYDGIFRQIGESVDVKHSRTPLLRALDNLESTARNSRNKPTCRETPSLANIPWKIVSLSFTPILDLDKGLLDAWTGEARTAADIQPVVCVHGDGSLDEHESNLATDVSEQKALMVLIEAKYIVEVLAVFGTQAEEQNEINPTHTWCPAISSKKLITSGKSELNIAHSPGEADVSEPPRQSCEELLTLAANYCRRTAEGVGTCEHVHMIPTAVSEYFAYLSTPMGADELDLGVSDYRDYLYGFYAGGISANHGSALAGGFEFGVPLHLIRSMQYALFTGFEARGKNPTSSQALTLRMVFELPQIGLALGPYAKFINVNNGTDSRVRLAYGARTELGFSLMSFYLAAGEDPRLYAPIRTAHSVSIEAGVEFLVNGRRLWDNTVGMLR